MSWSMELPSPMEALSNHLASSKDVLFKLLMLSQETGVSPKAQKLESRSLQEIKWKPGKVFDDNEIHNKSTVSNFDSSIKINNLCSNGKDCSTPKTTPLRSYGIKKIRKNEMEGKSSTHLRSQSKKNTMEGKGINRSNLKPDLSYYTLEELQGILQHESNSKTSTFSTPFVSSSTNSTPEATSEEENIVLSTIEPFTENETSFPNSVAIEDNNSLTSDNTNDESSINKKSDLELLMGMMKNVQNPLPRQRPIKKVKTWGTSTSSTLLSHHPIDEDEKNDDSDDENSSISHEMDKEIQILLDMMKKEESLNEKSYDSETITRNEQEFLGSTEKSSLFVPPRLPDMPFRDDYPIYRTTPFTVRPTVRRTTFSLFERSTFPSFERSTFPSFVRTTRKKAKDDFPKYFVTFRPRTTSTFLPKDSSEPESFLREFSKIKVSKPSYVELNLPIEDSRINDFNDKVIPFSEESQELSFKNKETTSNIFPPIPKFHGNHFKDSLDFESSEFQLPTIGHFPDRSDNKEYNTVDFVNPYLKNLNGADFIRLEIDQEKFKHNKTRPGSMHIPLMIKTSVAQQKKKIPTGIKMKSNLIKNIKKILPLRLIQEVLTNLPNAFKDLPHFMKGLVSNQAKWVSRSFKDSETPVDEKV